MSIRAIRVRLSQLAHALDHSSSHPQIGAALGLILVVSLVPILNIWRGFYGPLGPSIPLFFLIPVLLSSTIGGLRAGVLVSCVAIFVWDWFFIPPLFRVTIASTRDVLALVVFLAVALLTGQLSTAARRHAEDAIRRARSSEALYALSMALITGHDLTQTLPDLLEQLRATFDLDACAVLLPDSSGKGWHTAVACGPLPSGMSVETSRNMVALATWVNEHGQASGQSCADGRSLQRGRITRTRLEEAPIRLLPLRSGAHPFGVLELVQKSGAAPDRERDQLLATFANGASIALRQAQLSAEERDAALARESDRLKTVLLSSVSHDLRTPLAGIKAAASSLLQQDVQWSEEDRHAFISDIDAEADRLTRLVLNLLDLSRIETGAIKPQKDWEDVGELLTRVTSRLAPQLLTHTLIWAVDKDLPAVCLDAVQIEQVVTNLLENAAKYSPAGTPITVGATTAQDLDGHPAVRIWVVDCGPGIPVFEQSKIFDKFYRVTDTATRTSGTGMGLAIVKGLVDAHQGRVTVHSAHGEGSTFSIVLPIGQDEGGTRESAASLSPSQYRGASS